MRNPYNALFIETDDGASFRVLFDLDAFFCQSESPRAWPSKGRNSYRLVEPEELRPFFGRLFRSVSFDPISGGGRCLLLRFEDGGEVRYWNEVRPREFWLDPRIQGATPALCCTEASGPVVAVVVNQSSDIENTKASLLRELNKRHASEGKVALA